MLAGSVMLQLFAASGGFLVCLDWPALTPALTEIRLLVLLCRLAVSTIARRRAAVGGLAASWLFSSRRQAHFLLEHCTVVFLMPNV